MAGELDTTALAALLASPIMGQDLAELLYDPTDLRATLHEVPFSPNLGSTGVKMGLYQGDDAMASTADTSSVANTALGTGSVTLTVARQSLAYELTSLSALSVRDPSFIARLAALCVRGYVLRLTDMVVATHSGFTANTAVGVSGVDLTVDNVYSAMFALQLANVPGPWFASIHHQQYNDFQQSLRGELGAVQFRTDTQGVLRIGSPGFKGSWNNIEFISSDSVPTANGGADRDGLVYGVRAICYTVAPPATQDSMAAASMAARVEGNAVFLELDRTARAAMTAIISHSWVAVSEMEDARGVRIVTDA